MKTPKSYRPSKPNRISRNSLAILSALAALSAFAVKADTYYWQGATASYNTPADWNSGVVPVLTNSAVSANGAGNIVQVNVGDPDWTLGDLSAGGATGATGEIDQYGQTVNVQGWMHIGDGTNSSGKYVLNGGTLNQTNTGNQFFLGEGPGSTSELDINGGTINIGGTFHIVDGNWNGATPRSGTVNQNAGTVNAFGFTEIGVAAGGTAVYNLSGGIINMSPTADNQLVVGNIGGTGTLNMSGGVINSPAAELWIGNSGGSVGIINLSGNAVVNINNWIAPGRGGNGTLNISNNAVLTKTGTGNNFTIGSNLGGTGYGVVNQYGGFVTNTASPTWIGESATGKWFMEGGMAILGTVNICVDSSASGELSLDGGLFQTTGIITTGGSTPVSEILFNGATLQAGADNTSFISGITLANINSGGAVIDSQNYDITIPQELDGGGGLVKLGSGVLTLTGPNTYSGDTVVSNGTLIVNTVAGGSGNNYAVADGAAFGVTVATAGAQVQAGDLALGNGVGATLDFDLGGFGNPASAPLVVNGAAAIDGVITVNVANVSPQLGEFPLIQLSSALTGSGGFVLGPLPTGVTANLLTNATTGNIDLNITAINLPVWAGLAGGEWDIDVTTNWVNAGTGLPTYYTDGTTVQFNDTAPGTTTVNLVAGVTPKSVLFTNSVLSYTLTGTGSIEGSGGVTKEGSGTLAILNSGGNSYTGPTVIAGGTLSVTNLANGGTPSPIGASTASPANLVIAGGTLSYNGAPVAVNRGFTVAAVGSTIDAENNLTLGGQVTTNTVVSGESQFIKVGPGQLALTASADNELSANYNPGGMVQAGTLILDGSAGGQLNHNQNDFYVGCTPTSGASLIVSNTTFNVDGWLGLGRINGGINNTSTWAFYNATIHAGNVTVGWDGGTSGNLASQIITLNGNTTFTNYGSVNMDEGSGSTMWMSINDSSLYWVRNPFYIASATASTGSVVVANSGRIISANGWFDIGQGQNSVASLTLKNNGNLTTVGDVNLTDTGTGANATLTVQDNATVQADNLYVGKSGNSVALATITNSAVANFNSSIDLAGGDGSIGNLTIAGGSLTSGGDMTVGDNGTSVVNMVTNGGGVLTVHGTLYLSRSSQVADGTVNLNAGSTIIANYVNNGWGFHNNNPSPTDNPNAFNFNGGTLKAGVGSAYFIQPYVNAVVQAGGAVIDDGGYTIDVLAGLVTGGGNGGLTKLGNGTLHLDNTNTYTGTTLVSAGTLGVGPGGVIAGPVAVASGATLAGAIGAIGLPFSINSTLTLSNGSTTLMQITPSTNDEIVGLTGVNYGGALVVTNGSGSPLVVGQSYTLFSAATAGSGNFSSVTIVPSGSGTFNPATGVLTITSSGVVAFDPVSVSGGNLILTGSGGTAGSSYTLLSTTNLLTPLADWTTNAIGTTTATGAFSNAIPVSATTPAQFFRFKQP